MSQVSCCHRISSDLLLLFRNMVKHIIVETQDFDVVRVVELQLLQQITQTADLIVRHVQVTQ